MLSLGVLHLAVVLLSMTNGGHVTYKTDFGGGLPDRYIGVEAGGGTHHDTLCDIAVGYYTNTGGFGCIISGGISLGETKWCQLDTEFAIYANKTSEFGVFVVEEELCADGIVVVSVKTGEQNDYDSWSINKWVKVTDRVGAVIAESDGTVYRVDSWFTRPTVEYSTDFSQLMVNRSIGVEAGDGTHHDTLCDIAVGYYTESGGFGCVIYGGIAKGETKWCELEAKFGIYGGGPEEVGVFVVEEEGCADGIQVVSVKMGDRKDYNVWPYGINTWIKYTESKGGAVISRGDGTIERVNAYFTLSGLYGSLSYGIYPAYAYGSNDVRDNGDYDENDKVYWFTNWSNYEIVLSVWMITSFMIIGGLCKNIYSKNRELFKYKMVKNLSPSDDCLTEQEMASFM